MRSAARRMEPAFTPSRRDLLLGRTEMDDAPVCVLILGGTRDRELAAAAAAAQLPSAHAVILSSGVLSDDELCAAVWAGGGSAQCLTDRQALDTVTNFTSLAKAFAEAAIRHVAVATDAAHRPRALAIGHIVLGAYGIRVSALPVDVPGGSAEAESWLRLVRDVLRALLWAVTGLDGSSLAARIHPRRAADVREWRGQQAGGPQLARWLRDAFKAK